MTDLVEALEEHMRKVMFVSDSRRFLPSARRKKEVASREGDELLQRLTFLSWGSEYPLLSHFRDSE